MANLITRLASLVLAFGLFYGCSVFSSSSTQEPSVPQTKENLEQRLNYLNNQIQVNPRDPTLYFDKGNILNELAHKFEDPEARHTYYTRMRKTLSKADSLYDALIDETGKSNIKELLQVTWSNEHNQGVEIMQTDSTLTRESLEEATAHFSNAITIIPDSLISYELKARAHYRNQQSENAIKTLETAVNEVEQVPSPILEQLAFLYLETENPAKAIETYEQADSFSSSDPNVIHGLANAYMLAGRHQRAIYLLRQLVERDPNNALYRQTLGNELYSMGSTVVDSLITSGINITREDFDYIDSLFTDSEKQLEDARSLNPGNGEFKQNLAFFHQNYATQLKKINKFYSSADSSVIEEEVREHLKSAIKLLEELTDEYPDNRQYWKNLYQAYSYLGMTEKAREARQKSNL